MKTQLTFALLAAFLTSAAQAQTAAPAPAATAMPAAAASTPVAAIAEMAEGEVRKIDKETKKITLKHGFIKSIDMPPMTMVFQVKDVALLDKAKVGDKVRFQAEDNKGAFTVTVLEIAGASATK